MEPIAPPSHPFRSSRCPSSQPPSPSSPHPSHSAPVKPPRMGSVRVVNTSGGVFLVQAGRRMRKCGREHGWAPPTAQPVDQNGVIPKRICKRLGSCVSFWVEKQRLARLTRHGRYEPSAGISLKLAFTGFAENMDRRIIVLHCYRSLKWNDP